MSDDQPLDPLADCPFTWRELQDGRVFLSHEGRHVETLTGRDAERFLRKARASDERGQQLLMAKATKNFKRGNERQAKQRGR
ncbi:MAG: hypothetical protein AAF533_13145 [Acidobacteriota bacterium]